MKTNTPIFETALVDFRRFNEKQLKDAREGFRAANRAAFNTSDEVLDLYLRGLLRQHIHLDTRLERARGLAWACGYAMGLKELER